MLNLQTRRNQFLLALGKCTDRPLFGLLHRTARLVYLHLFCPPFERYFRKKLHISSLRLVPQGSVLRPADFNLFFSDIDFLLIIPETPGAQTLSTCLDLIASVRARFKFIGEFEIYSNEEYEARQVLKARHGKFLDLIWYLRKWHRPDCSARVRALALSPLQGKSRDPQNCRKTEFSTPLSGTWTYAR